MIFGFYCTEWCNRNNCFCSTRTLWSNLYRSRGCDNFPLFWCQYVIDERAAIPISAAFQVLKLMLILLWSNMNPFFMWMWNCHNLYFQDESPLLYGTPRCMCSLARPLIRTQRFMCLGHFSSQISLTWSEQGIELVSPFIVWYSHPALYLFF